MNRIQIYCCIFNVVKTSLPIVNGNVELGHVRLDNVLDRRGHLKLEVHENTSLVQLLGAAWSCFHNRRCKKVQNKNFKKSHSFKKNRIKIRGLQELYTKCRCKIIIVLKFWDKKPKWIKIRGLLEPYTNVWFFFWTLLKNVTISSPEVNKKSVDQTDGLTRTWSSWKVSIRNTVFICRLLMKSQLQLPRISERNLPGTIVPWRDIFEIDVIIPKENFWEFLKIINAIRKLIKFCILHPRLPVIGLCCWVK